jgi:hypothetical protein
MDQIKPVFGFRTSTRTPIQAQTRTRNSGRQSITLCADHIRVKGIDVWLAG